MNQIIRRIRHQFYRELPAALRVVWPVLSSIPGIMLGLGLLVGHFEDWHPLEGIYSAFVTALTVGYGDFVPRHYISRITAVGIGFTGILLTASFAAVSARALGSAARETYQKPASSPVRAPK